MAVDHARIQANLRHMAAFESKPNPRPLPDTAVTRGFEKVAFPKLVRELQDPNLIVRQKALLAARELLAVPINHVQCIAAGITPAIVALLADADDTVRQRAAGAARAIVTKELGAKDLIQHAGVDALVVALEDAVPAVRDEAYAALVEACRFDPARRALEAPEDALPRILQLAQLEAPGPRAVQSLRLLNACVQVRYNEAVLTQLIDYGDAVPTLTELLSPHLPEALRQQAAELLGALASREDAKLAAVQVGGVGALLACLEPAAPGPHTSVALATAATGALMAVTVVREAKYAALQAPGGLAALVRVLDPSNEQLCVNAMGCIANVAEAPEARAELAKAGAEAKLGSIFQGAVGSDAMKRSAAQAIRQCRFKNWPYEVLPGARAPEVA